MQTVSQHRTHVLDARREMKPFLHTRGSVKRWGGKVEDYLPIHDFIDSTKIAMPDLRHRAVLHNAFGCFLVERVFGHTLINSDGKEVSTRDIAENHIIEDLGFLPSLEDWLDDLPQAKWHGGIHRMTKEERPPTPEEERQATRDRVFTVFANTDKVEADDEQLITAVIAAVRGIEKEKE